MKTLWLKFYLVRLGLAGCLYQDGQSFQGFDVSQQGLVLFWRHLQFLCWEWICAEWLSSLTVFHFIESFIHFLQSDFKGPYSFWDSTTHNALLLPLRLLHQMHCFSFSHSLIIVSVFWVWLVHSLTPRLSIWHPESSSSSTQTCRWANIKPVVKAECLQISTCKLGNMRHSICDIKSHLSTFISLFKLSYDCRRWKTAKDRLALVTYFRSLQQKFVTPRIPRVELVPFVLYIHLCFT